MSKHEGPPPNRCVNKEGACTPPHMDGNQFVTCINTQCTDPEISLCEHVETFVDGVCVVGAQGGHALSPREIVVLTHRIREVLTLFVDMTQYDDEYDEI